MQFVQTRPLVLASGSPRRKDYLARYGLSFRTLIPDIPETALPGESPLDYARRLAREKARAVVGACKTNELILAADTIVVLDGCILGKPSSRDDAHTMLIRLSGKSHEVITAYALLDRRSSTEIVRHSTASVTFRPIPEAWIEGYLDSEEPYDKAGSYSLQGIGTLFVASVHGSTNTVIGLPIEMVMADLWDQGWIKLA